MRTRTPLLSILFLLLLASTAQGIRLDEQLISFLYKKVHEKGSPVEGDGAGHDGGVPTLRHPEVFAERSRNLMSKTVAKAKVDKEVKSDIGTTREKPQTRKKPVMKDLNMEASNIEQKELPPETYPDLLDIAGMDYSPAKRKPPIHN